jgi:hypothetical protein
MGEIPATLIQFILFLVYQSRSNANFIISPGNTPGD